MAIYNPANAEIRSFISIACLAEVFSPDILIYSVIYLLDAMKGVRCGISPLKKGTEKHCLGHIVSLGRFLGLSRQEIQGARVLG